MFNNYFFINNFHVKSTQLHLKNIKPSEQTTKMVRMVGKKNQIIYYLIFFAISMMQYLLYK